MMTIQCLQTVWYYNDGHARNQCIPVEIFLRSDGKSW